MELTKVVSKQCRTENPAGYQQNRPNADVAAGVFGVADMSPQRDISASQYAFPHGLLLARWDCSEHLLSEQFDEIAFD